MNAELESSLQGHWIHSHEEDSNNLMVFRRSTYSFPPARGRNEYMLLNGGTMQLIGSGPTDKRESVDGTWSLEEEVLVIRPVTGNSRRFRIISVDSDRLVMTSQ
jgi:hypothetical protein